MYISFKNKTCRYNVYIPYIVDEVPSICSLFRVLINAMLDVSYGFVFRSVTVNSHVKDNHWHVFECTCIRHTWVRVKSYRYIVMVDNLKHSTRFTQ